ncbi:MAG: CoA transferase [Chloroflexi bacterium]|nr:CoA transferase [Chloroflexota bacterium]
MPKRKSRAKPKSTMEGPLSGIVVLDWTVMQQGPVTSMMLGDLGAEVIKIEQRGIGDPGRAIRRRQGEVAPPLPGGLNWYFETWNRNKKSIALDLSKEKGKEIIYRLVKKADVFVENYRFGVAAKLGMDYETLSKHNPRLVYGNATGWGVNGPDAAKPAFDSAAQSRSGFMYSLGEEDMPPLFGPLGMSDQVGGGSLAYGILAALFLRERTGVGQEVRSSLLGSLIWLQQSQVSYNLLFGGVRPKRYSRDKVANPLNNRYKCGDQNWICLNMSQSDRYWHDFCQAVGLQSLERDPRFSDAEKRQEHGEELVVILDKVFGAKARADWMRILDDPRFDLIYAPINSVSDLTHDPQALENGYITSIKHPVLGDISVVGSPVSFSAAQAGPRSAAPEFGQHTEEVLLQMGGYTWDEIAQFKDEEVI